ncbi:hypothetical protein [Pseudarthrobacter oxydans]|uniref:hypothetical protein n=1 Tax=Pseudarthrobacter oxydans TaxID=1671 RepID=UPI00344879E8
MPEPHGEWAQARRGHQDHIGIAHEPGRGVGAETASHAQAPLAVEEVERQSGSGGQWLTVVGLDILAAIFTVGFMGEDSRPQLLSTFALVAVLAVANWLNHRRRRAAPIAESSDRAKEPLLID